MWEALLIVMLGVMICVALVFWGLAVLAGQSLEIDGEVSK